jgi:predicted RNA-binding protein Jag
MSATEFEDTGAPLPRISEIRALPDFRLAIVWAEGSRTGRADFVDLAPVINTYKLYRPLRNNGELFQTARLVDHGNVVEWGDGTIDMPAELIEDIANEAMTPQDFASFLRRNDLTQEDAAALLGYSRRQIENFVSTGLIPRVVALACFGYEARSGTYRERQPLPETLPNTYEQVTKETRAMLSQVAQHFTEQLKDMRSEMRSEIELMRDELRKSILGLPQETAEGAAQMRRVIVDQIEALAELNRIVARHGRTLDMVEPIEIEPAEPPPRRDVARENHVPPPQRTKGAAEPPGWLSGLLTRAAQDTNAPPREAAGREPPPDAARDERHAIESLDSIAVDIARMIDHAAAAELWDRYKRGERNVFTHMLCTMQGQRAVEDILWRYRSDREFMQTVDRYIAEFEQLLDEVSRDDRGEMVARSYLTSETGKVYNMLAHAAGRLDR